MRDSLLYRESESLSLFFIEESMYVVRAVAMAVIVAEAMAVVPRQQPMP